MIVGRALTTGFHESNKVTDEDINYDWMKEYPYYIKLYNVELIEKKAKFGISRKIMLEEYPDAKKHYQQAYVELSYEEVMFINKQLDELPRKRY